MTTKKNKGKYLVDLTKSLKYKKFIETYAEERGLNETVVLKQLLFSKIDELSLEQPNIITKVDKIEEKPKKDMMKNFDIFNK